MLAPDPHPQAQASNSPGEGLVSKLVWQCQHCWVVISPDISQEHQGIAGTEVPIRVPLLSETCIITTSYVHSVPAAQG